MPLPILSLVPNTSNYTSKLGSVAVVNQLRGGAPRIRLDQLNAVSIVDCQWTVNANDFTYLNAFFRTTTVNGTLPFQTNLIVDLAAPTTYQCQFVEDTFTLTGQSGLTYSLQASLYVTLLAPDVLFDGSIVDLYTAYATGDNASNVLNQLATFVNISLGVI